MNDGWRPSAGIDALRLRARLLERVREYFRVRDVLEVETPVAVARTVSDPQIESLQLTGDAPRYLHTSPEYAMKRLLAAGSGDVFQVCKVFRAGERSALHNPEFTMIEWYRVEMDLPGIMAETAGLAALLLADGWPHAGLPVEYLDYQAAFRRELQIDPLEVPMAVLAPLCVKHGLAAGSAADASRDQLLDFLVATQIGPNLGRHGLTCLHHYPASQAALAQLDAGDARTALRFELYAAGVELANGYVELADAGEQARRFALDHQLRQVRGLASIDADERLLAALQSGLPPCAGVALGFDRVAMLAAGATHIDAVLAFPWERA
ncbi:MAG TPA: EF-P lysine aminoacylase EpmA [Steroidobacteraceae bacterium]|nr:EF-P lysine aminoacylase EpmA [Steroidobacteraceae bacterium]